MFSQFFLLSSRGEAIINRDFRGETKKGSAEIFFRKFKIWSGNIPPIFNSDGVNYINIRMSTLFFVLTTLENISPSFAIDLLQRLTSIIKDFCGLLSEENIRKNFTLIYEILDEVIDFGYPQSTNTELLKESIFNKATIIDPSLLSQNAVIPSYTSNTPKTLPINASFRPVGISNSSDIYNTNNNDIFVDILENVAVVLNSEGYILNSSIDGSIKIKSYIDQNPEIRMAINEDTIIRSRDTDFQGSDYPNTVLDDCNFHPCADLSQFDEFKTITFTPPKGEFFLMNYRVTGDIKLPFRVIPTVKVTEPYMIDLIIKIQANIPKNIGGSNVKIIFPTPHNTSFTVCDIFPSSIGQNSDYNPNDKKVIWSINTIQGSTEHSIRCRITLSSVVSSSSLKEISPINMQFEIPTFSASGLQILNLRLTEPKFGTVNRWVRYITQSLSYVCRL